MPEMLAVESSSVEAVGYDGDARELHVRFVGGGLYVYAGVEREVFDALMFAPSKGAYVNLQLKPRGYECERRA